MADTSHLSPAVRELAEAIRLTREFVGEEMLPPIEGWEWYDALRRWAPEYLPSTEPPTPVVPGPDDMPCLVEGELVFATAPPCPMRTQNHPHDAHDWNAGEGRCPGFSAPDEGVKEPAPPQTAEERAHDLEHMLQRVREAVGTDQPAMPVEPVDSRLAAIVREVLGIDLTAGKPDITAALFIACRELEKSEASREFVRRDRGEARNWARHGYEIGQRHCGWSDHGVAPAWLTEGWPRSFDSCEHTKQAAEYDTALARVRGLPEAPGVILGNRGEPVGDSATYLLGYKMAIRDAARAADFATEEGTGSDVACCVCGRGDGWAVYRNYKGQLFCWPCADCACGQDPCVRTGINTPMESTPPIKPETAPDCTASIAVAYQDARIRCTQPAGHYDFEVKPDPYAEPHGPGGWHVNGDYHWADIAEGATPHGESP